MTDGVGGYLWPKSTRAFVFLLCLTCTDIIKRQVCVCWLYCDKANRSLNESHKFCQLHITMPQTIFPGFVAWLTANLILFFFFLLELIIMQFRQNFLFVYPNLLGSVSFCLRFIIISEEFHQAKASSFSKQSGPSQTVVKATGNAQCEPPRKGCLNNVAAQT